MAADFECRAGTRRLPYAHTQTQVPKQGLRKQRPCTDHRLQFFENALVLGLLKAEFCHQFVEGWPADSELDRGRGNFP